MNFPNLLEKSSCKESSISVKFYWDLQGILLVLNFKQWIIPVWKTNQCIFSSNILWFKQSKFVNLWKSGQFDYPVNICLFKVSNRNTSQTCNVCSKLTLKTPERIHWRRSDLFNVSFEHISHFFLVFLLLFWTGKCWLGISFHFP